MKIYDTEGTEILDIEPDKQSYGVSTLLDIDKAVLYYSLASHVELPVGAYIEFGGVRYTLQAPESFVMHHTRNYEYTVTFHAPGYGAMVWMFANPIDHRLSFDLTATPREHLQMFVDNMNKRDSGWRIGVCPDNMAEKVITYDYVYCLDALKLMADAFRTEWQIVNKTVSLRMVESHKSDPIVLKYGKDNGYKPDVQRSNSSDIPPADRLYVEGGDRNIDYSKYGTLLATEEEIPGSVIVSDGRFVHSRTLLLPRNATLRYDGEKFEDEQGFVPANARTYKTDELGLSVTWTGNQRRTSTEAAMQATEQYPRRIGEVTDVVCVDEEQHLYDFIDNTIPAALDYSTCGIEGETMKIVFQSGMLAGREFDIDGGEEGYSHTDRRFRLVPQDYDGMTMPNGDGFAPAVGDKYIVIGCRLPNAYICDNSTKSGAEWDMLRQAVRHLHQIEDYQYTVTGDIDEIWLLNNWLRLKNRFAIGEYVRFRDQLINTDVLLRMTSIKRSILKPWRVELTTSNAPLKPDLSTELMRIEGEQRRQQRRQYQRYTYDGLRPIQYRCRYIDNSTPPHEVVPTIQHNQASDTLVVSGGTIQHRPDDEILLRGGQTSVQYNDTYTIEGADLSFSDTTSDHYLYAKIDTRDHAASLYVLSADKINYIDGYYRYLCLYRVTPPVSGQRAIARLYAWDNRTIGSVVGDIVTWIGNTPSEVSEVLRSHENDIQTHGQNISTLNQQQTHTRTSLNNVIERANDLTTLLTTRLTDAFNAFNAAQSAEGGNTINVDFCIEDGSQHGEAHCKTFPEITPVTNN